MNSGKVVHAKCMSELVHGGESEAIYKMGDSIAASDGSSIDKPVCTTHKCIYEPPNDHAWGSEPAQKEPIVCLTHACSVSVPTGNSSDSDPKESTLTQLQASDPELVAMLSYLQENKLPGDATLASRVVAESSQFVVLDGVLCFDGTACNSTGKAHIAVPECMRDDVSREPHGGCFAGHFTKKRTYELLKRQYWWKTMRADVREHCQAYLICASRGGTGRAFRPSLQLIPVSGPFNRIGVDVLQFSMSYNENRYAIVFCDYLTKWPEVFPSTYQKAETIARLLVEQIVSRHGVPEQLLSDRGQNFLSDLVLEVCCLLGTKKVNTTGYHPQTDGLVERMNRTLITMLSKCVAKHGIDWDERLPYVLFAYRVTIHESTRESPFHLLYGRDAQIPADRSDRSQG